MSTPCHRGAGPVGSAACRPDGPLRALPAAAAASVSRRLSGRDQGDQGQPVAVDELVDLRGQAAAGAAASVIRRLESRIRVIRWFPCRPLTRAPSGQRTSLKRVCWPNPRSRRHTRQPRVGESRTRHPTTSTPLCNGDRRCTRTRADGHRRRRRYRQDRSDLPRLLHQRRCSGTRVRSAGVQRNRTGQICRRLGLNMRLSPGSAGGPRSRVTRACVPTASTSCRHLPTAKCSCTAAAGSVSSYTATLSRLPLKWNVVWLPANR